MIMKILIALFLLICPQLALAQSQRNPCVYGVGTNNVTSLQGNCLAVGYYLAGVTGAPMPVGGIANASAPTFTEAKPGYLSFDLSGNLRVIATTTPSGTQNINLTQISGASPSLTNPLWVFPATGATFPVSGTVTTVGASTGGGFPNGASAITVSATGTTGVTTATIAVVSAKFNYLCGFTISSDATAALAGTATVTGIVGGTLSFIQNVGTATAAGVLTQNFNPCLQSSAINTAVVVNSIAAGVGGNTAVVAWGYNQ